MPRSASVVAPTWPIGPVASRAPRKNSWSKTKDAFLPLPKQTFESRKLDQVSADSQSLVRFDTNSYSVPVKYAHRKITIIATVEEVRLAYEDRLMARHRRCWQEGTVPFRAGALLGIAGT